MMGHFHISVCALQLLLLLLFPQKWNSSSLLFDPCVLRPNDRLSQLLLFTCRSGPEDTQFQ